jgi:sterol desaturase/sphingolipid hydroxylase (fatty acid hydroxylase superfamily)
VRLTIDQIISTTSPLLSGLVVGVLVSLFCVLIGFSIEHSLAPRPPRLSAVAFNLIYSAVSSTIQALLRPAMATVIGLAAAAGGGGLIALPDGEWQLAPALAAYILAMDFGEYLFHRAQHRIPALWAMHSLHHSDPDMNVSTTARHFWAEHALKSLTVYLAVGLIFKANPTILGAYGLIGFYNYFAHMNVRVGFGRFSMLLNAPLYHRIHHSMRPADENLNFAALFPIFDVICGSYRAPEPHEMPVTGLASRETPANLLEAVFWPFRERNDRRLGLPTRL